MVNESIRVRMTGICNFKRMKKYTVLIALMTSFMTNAQNSIHDFSFIMIDGTEKSFVDFKGKKIMIVNTASECGFTPQYMELQEMHERHGDSLVIIGFPANNFGSQEPGSNNEIQAFCQKNYGVTFLLSEKVSVEGADRIELFTWLCTQTGAKHEGGIKWNFEKFILDEDGKLMARFRSITSPDSKKIVDILAN